MKQLFLYNFKNSIYFFVPFLVCIFYNSNLKAQTYVVSGAPLTQYNGEYVQSGSENGKPAYLMETNYKIWYDLSGQEWRIGYYEGTEGMWVREYRVISNADTPPQTGWTDGWGTSVPSLNVILKTPADYIVSGAPSTQYNGGYIQSGTEEGKPAYLMGTDYKISYYLIEWRISYYEGTEGMWFREYRVISNADTPPQTGWTDGSDISVPSLKVTSSSQTLRLHLRSDQGVVTSGSSVSEWDDISGLGNNATQGTGVNQPTYVTNAMNNLPVIKFNGSTSSLLLPSSATLGIQSHDYEMFIVAQSSYTANPEFLISGAAGEMFEYHLNGAAGIRFIPITAIYLDKSSTGTYADGKPHVFAARASSTGGAVRVDGIDGGTSSANITSSNAGNLQLGVRSDGTCYFFNGDIAEVIIYNAILSSADRNTVELDLADRYGITSGNLPVELTSFTANAMDSKVRLKWITATEVNNYGFSVERSEASLNNPEAGASSYIWETIGFVQGHGNSNSPKEYSFTDNNLQQGNIRYRLKQIDNDGQYKYSDVVEVAFNLSPSAFELFQNYPNPFNPSTTISYQIPVAGHVTLKVYNAIGSQVATLVNKEKPAGNYEVRFDAPSAAGGLTSGIYYYTIRAGEYNSAKKMLVLK